MLDRDLVPSPLEQPGRRRVEIRPPGPPPRHPRLRVIRAFGGYLLTNLRLRLSGTLDEENRAVRLRQVFEELGGLWVKVGQLVSLRTDIFSEPVCRELSRLQHRAIGFPFEEVERILRQELGDDLDAVFTAFEREPLAAASVSQVHVARLRATRAVVAVKVRRPAAEIAFGRDLQFLKWLVRVLNVLAPHVHLPEALWELEQMVKEELDFRFEAANTRRMRRSLREHDIHVPNVYRDWCTRNVLVTEFVPGVLMSDFIRLMQEDPAAARRWCLENDVQPRRVGTRLFRSILRQLLEDNLFHADIHPGNIILLRDSHVALIDFGTIGTCEKTFLATYKASLRAMAEKDFSKAADMTLQFAISPPSISDIGDLKRDLVRCFREWEAVSHLDDVGYHNRSLGAAGMASGQVMARYKVQLSWQFMRISRTWGTLDSSLSLLLPDANYINLFNGYFRDAARRQRTPRRVLANAVETVESLAATVSEYRTVLEPIVFGQAIYRRTFMSGSMRFARVAGILFRWLRNGAILALLFGGAMYLQLLHNVADHEIIRTMTNNFEHLDHGDWLMTFGLILFVALVLHRLVRGIIPRS